MPKVRLLVPHGEHGAGAVIDVDDETFAALRADGKAASVADEEAAAKAAQEGNYSARTTRPEESAAKEEKKK